MLRLLACSFAALLAAALLAAALPGCGPEDAGDRNGYGGTGQKGVADRTVYVGQEIWLTYDSPPHAGIGIRAQRTRDDARTLAEDLRAKALKGADIGVLAQVHSNAPGARADGFSGVLPRDPKHPDDRDRALMRTPLGGVTDLVDWNGGWWFAKRVAPDVGKKLEQVFRAQVQAGEEAQKTRVRARAIVFSYVGSWPYRYQVTDTLDQATIKARKVLAAIQAGADFAKVAKEGLADIGLSGSWDTSGDRGGELLATVAPGKGGRWISRLDSGYPNALLEVLFAAPVGLYPEPVVTARGVVVLEILERRVVTPDEIGR